MSDAQWEAQVTPVLRTLQIIVGSLVAGCVFFVGVVLFVSGEVAAAGESPLVSYVAIAFAVMAVLARVAIPRVLVAAGRQSILGERGPEGGQDETPDQSATVARLLQLLSTTTIVACAILEGATFFLLVAYLTERWLPVLALAVALMGLLALHVPSRSRAIHWIEDQLALLEQEQRRGG